MATKLFLIRHGQTEANRKKRYSRHADIGLNATGRAQARSLRKRLLKEKIDRVYSSDRKRAIETAVIIFKGKKIKKVAGLKEIHFGRFEGLTYAQIMAKYPAVYRKWLRDPYSITIPEGESLWDLKKRVVAAIKRIMARHPGKTIAIVTHGGVISIFLNYISKTKDFWRKVPKSGSVIKWER